MLNRLANGAPAEGEEEEDEEREGAQHEDDDPFDTEEALRNAFEHQEITLRQALYVISS